jgi:signal transduction histidine kinase
MEAVGRLAGGIAHDFNNFLTVIGGTLDLLEADLGPDDPRREDVEEIMEVTDRARTLTRQLLDFSRGESGERGNVDMNQVVSGLERMLGRLLPATVRLETLLAEEPAVIYADLGQMEQVLMNLVINARDAVGDGGRITVTTTVLGAEGEPAEEHAYGPGVVVSVRDDGVGMDEATRSKIFEPFFTTKGPDKGTGLGLATVYGIVSSHWGRITVASEVGVGSVFEVWLPFSSAERPGSA